MKLLRLAGGFAPSSHTLLPSPAPVEKLTGLKSQRSTRYTSTVLIILLVFAGFSLTVPLHPSRIRGSASCSNAAVLAAETTVSDCPDLATVPTNYNVVIKNIANLAVTNLLPGSRSNLSEAANHNPPRNITFTGRVTAKNTNS